MGQLVARLRWRARSSAILLGLALAELALFSVLAILFLNGHVYEYLNPPPAAGVNCGVDSCFNRSRLLLAGLAGLYSLAMVAALMLQLLLLAWSRHRGRVFCTVLQQLQLIALIPLLFTDYRYF